MTIHAMENHWQGEAFAQLNLGCEGCELQGIGCGAKAVETTFADEAGGRHLCLYRREFRLPVVGEMPRMQTEGGEGLFAGMRGRVRMDIKVGEHGVSGGIAGERNRGKRRTCPARGHSRGLPMDDSSADAALPSIVRARHHVFELLPQHTANMWVYSDMKEESTVK